MNWKLFIINWLIYGFGLIIAWWSISDNNDPTMTIIRIIIIVVVMSIFQRLTEYIKNKDGSYGKRKE